MKIFFNIFEELFSQGKNKIRAQSYLINIFENTSNY